MSSAFAYACWSQVLQFSGVVGNLYTLAIWLLLYIYEVSSVMGARWRMNHQTATSALWSNALV